MSVRVRQSLVREFGTKNSQTSVAWWCNIIRIAAQGSNFMVFWNEESYYIWAADEFQVWTGCTQTWKGYDTVQKCTHESSTRQSRVHFTHPCNECRPFCVPIDIKDAATHSHAGNKFNAVVTWRGAQLFQICAPAAEPKTKPRHAWICSESAEQGGRPAELLHVCVNAADQTWWRGWRLNFIHKKGNRLSYI